MNVLTERHQKCLDSGIDMLNCSKNFYLQMDSILNVVYNKLRRNLNPKEKEVLKKEQLSWLKDRDIFFKKQNIEFEKKFNGGEWGSDMYMITYQNDAEFVKKRVIFLMSQLK